MRKWLIGFSLLFAVIASVASGAVISGQVIDTMNPGNPISNATVTLKSSGADTFTNVSGQFTLSVNSSATIFRQVLVTDAIKIDGSTLFFSVKTNERLRVDLFTLQGRRIGTGFNRTFGEGVYSLPLTSFLGKSIGAGPVMMKITKGNEQLIHICIPTGSSSGLNVGSSSGMAAASGGKSIMKAVPRAGITTAAASVDSLIVTDFGYLPAAVALSSDATQNVGTIVLHLTPTEFSVWHKADSVLALMSNTQKAGQMTEVQLNNSSGNGSGGRLTNQQVASMCIGSVFNGGSDAVLSATGNTPQDLAGCVDTAQSVNMSQSALKIPFIYGQDVIHGVAEIYGCTVFPHNIGLGCTHDSALVDTMGQITALEAAACGIRLMFGPTVTTPRDIRWGRAFEGFGEEPTDNVNVGLAEMRGEQGNGNINQNKAIACCIKHYIGDGGTSGGVNAGIDSLTDSTVEALHFPQYVYGAREGAATVMISYNGWYRKPFGPFFREIFDSNSVGTMLKKQAGFTGFTISDWEGIPTYCSGGDNYTAACIAQAVDAGLDMAMIVGGSNPSVYINNIVADIANGSIPQARVDDAVRRILRTKFRMGLFSHPYSDTAARAQIFSASSQAVARRLVRESLVLLQNSTANGAPVLPLKSTDKVVVVGPYANEMGTQCGGWTISWQGSATQTGIAGQTILAGLQSVGGSANVTYDQSATNLAAENPTKIILVLGEIPYAEGYGDNLDNVTLANEANYSLLSTCYQSGKPVILVLLSGRPLILSSTDLTEVKGLVAAWLPGSMGIGVADVLYGGSYNFTGTLTQTWPASYGQIPIHGGKVYADEPHGSGGSPLYPYGYGLQYSQ